MEWVLTLGAIGAAIGAVTGGLMWVPERTTLAVGYPVTMAVGAAGGAGTGLVLASFLPREALALALFLVFAMSFGFAAPVVGLAQNPVAAGPVRGALVPVSLVKGSPASPVQAPTRAPTRAPV